MRQIRLDMTKEFERNLPRFMRRKGIADECRAVQQPVHEGIIGPRAELRVILPSAR